MEIKPIGYIKTDFKEKFGIPRQSMRCDAKGIIYFYPPYNAVESFIGLKEFSHIYIIFDFSLSHKDKFSPTVRPPRLGGNKRVGVFATRSPFRPNNLGLSVVKLDKIERTENGIRLLVSGVDILDGTPVFDIKPYIPYADCVFGAIGSFAEEKKSHKLKVIDKNNLTQKLKDKRFTLLSCIEDDPRPSYQTDEREYKFSFGGYEIAFKVIGDVAEITQVK